MTETFLARKLERYNENNGKCFSLSKNIRRNLTVLKQHEQNNFLIIEFYMKKKNKKHFVIIIFKEY